MFLARDVVLLEGYKYQEVSNKAAAESIFYGTLRLLSFPKLTGSVNIGCQILVCLIHTHTARPVVTGQSQQFVSDSASKR